jgi:hypothetical protein
MNRINFSMVTIFAFVLATCSTAKSASAQIERPEDLSHWTPEAARGPLGDDWRKADERAWSDGRLALMDFGPVMAGSVVGFADGNRQGEKRIHAVSGLCVRVGDQRQANVVYEKNLCQCQGAWFGAINVASFRFGLYTKPTNDAPLFFSVPASVPWAKDGSFDLKRETTDFPAPRDWVDWRAVHQYGPRTVLEYAVGDVRVLEHPWMEEDAGTRVISRSFEVAPCEHELLLRLMPAEDPVFRYFGAGWYCFYEGKNSAAVALIGGRNGVSDAGRLVSLAVKDGWVLARIFPRKAPVTFKILHGTHDEQGAFEGLGTRSPLPESLEKMTHGGQKNWPQEMETSIETEGTDLAFRNLITNSPRRSEDVEPVGRQAYVVDHLLPPLDNPWRALCFFSGIDFLPDGRVAMCTPYGDVWTVNRLNTMRPLWKRFATGLNQPLGLKVVDGQVHVIERGQITRVVDVDGDGEADSLQKVNNRWHDAGQEHAFNMGLEFWDGNFYFNKSGEWGGPHGGKLLKVPANGDDATVLFHGLRHTNGLGLTPDGRITCAGQQGDWTPSSRVDICREGGFGGLMPTAPQNPSPLIYDEPLAWLPIDLDSSAADQVFAPKQWGPLGGQMLHLSWGQCSVIHLMRDKIGDMEQAAACRVPIARTLSGCARGRFSPHDGQLYLACLNGWQCRNTWDGVLERVRFVGGGLSEYPAPVAAQSIPGGLAITFGCELNPQTAADAARYSVQQWNYWWCSEYGSADYSLRERNKEKRDQLQISKVTLRPDRQTVELAIDDIQPAMQTRVVYDLKSASGSEMKESIDFTLHRIRTTLRKPFAIEPGNWSEPFGEGVLQATYRLKPGGMLTIDLREGQEGQVGYQLLIGEAQCEFHDRWRIAHPEDAKDRFPVLPPVIKAAIPKANPAENQSLRVEMNGRWIRVWSGEDLVLERLENDTRAALFGRMRITPNEGCELRSAQLGPMD